MTMQNRLLSMYCLLIPGFSKVLVKYSKTKDSCFVFFYPVMYCVISVRIRSYCGPHFPAFSRIWTEYGVFSPNAGNCGKNADHNNSDTDTFYAVMYFFDGINHPIITAITNGK